MGTRPDGTVVRVTADNVVFDNFRVRAELGGKPVPAPPTMGGGTPPPPPGGCAPAMPCIGGGLGAGPAGGIIAGLALAPVIVNSKVAQSFVDFTSPTLDYSTTAVANLPLCSGSAKEPEWLSH